MIHGDDNMNLVCNMLSFYAVNSQAHTDQDTIAALQKEIKSLKEQMSHGQTGEHIAKCLLLLPLSMTGL